ncbi:anti-sigma factor [soil metagenome]
MNACPDQILLLHGLLDGELDAVNSLAMETHLKSCSACAHELYRMQQLRTILSQAGIRHAAPQGMASRIEGALDRSGDGASVVAARPDRTGKAPRFAGGAMTALAASIALLLVVPQMTASGTEDQLVASHVRSLLAGHLTDVATSDRHVVKPWFNGRIDFAPPVVELAGNGFPLIGGRLDYVDGRVVPAIVYRRRLHSINLFVRPAGTLSLGTRLVTQREGYSLVRWTQGGLEFWAISDIDATELETFQRLFEASAHVAPQR